MDQVGHTRRTVSLPDHERPEISSDEVIGLRDRETLTEYPLDPRVQIYHLGAAVGSDVRIPDDPYLSALHGIAVRRKGTLRYSSQGKNGSYLNQARSDSGYIHDGCQLRLGKTTLVAYSESSRYDLTPFERLRGNSDQFTEVRDTAIVVAATSSHALITGERGSGRHTMAEMIHQESPRAAEPFIVVDCDLLDRTEALCVFFGDSTRRSAIEMARGGTLVIHEITEIPQPAITPLLRVLRNLDKNHIRVIATSTMPALVRSRCRWFIDHATTLEIPALRHRWQDIPALVDLFLFEFRRFASAKRSIPSKTLVAMCGHEWPGNITELREAIRAAIVRSTTEGLSLDLFWRPETAERLIKRALAIAYRQEGSIRKAATALGVPKSTYVSLADQLGLGTLS